MSRSKLTKFVLYPAAGLLGLLLVAAGSVYGVSAYRLQRQHSVQVRPIPVPSSASAVGQGKHLVTTRGCMDCHAPDLAGKKVVDDPAVGQFYGANLTRGVGGLAADTTDLDFVRAIRHGVARDGRTLVLMPSHEYTSMTDEDLGAVIAYVKSVPAVDRPRGPVSPGPLARLLIVLGEIKLPAEEIDHAAIQPAALVPAANATYGKYLVANCIGCHGPNLSGGKIPGAPPAWPASSNLTPHASANLSQWNEAQFLEVLRTHQRPDGTKLDPVMPVAFGQMTDLELKALWAYLKTLPPTATAAR